MLIFHNSDKYHEIFEPNPWYRDYFFYWYADRYFHFFDLPYFYLFEVEKWQVEPREPWDVTEKHYKEFQEPHEGYVEPPHVISRHTLTPIMICKNEEGVFTVVKPDNYAGIIVPLKEKPFLEIDVVGDIID